MPPRIKYGSDCSGIEAPFIALLKLLNKKDIQHVFASDIDAHAREMIKANYKPMALYNSVAERPHSYVDFYFAGFPCQTFSTAGSRRGFDDIRGTVFFDIYNYLLRVKPKVVILENVKGLLTHDQGRTFKVIMDLLNELGAYTIDYKVMSPHSHANWPQHRPRVFIVCIRNDALAKPFVFPTEIPLTKKASSLVNTRLHGNIETLSGFEYKNLTTHRADMIQKNGNDIMKDYYFFDIGATVAFGKPMREIVPALKASRTNYYITKLHRKLMTSEIAAIQGFPHLEVVVSDPQYQKQLGNSVCVPLLEILFREILMAVRF